MKSAFYFARYSIFASSISLSVWILSSLFNASITLLESQHDHAQNLLEMQRRLDMVAIRRLSDALKELQTSPTADGAEIAA